VGGGDRRAGHGGVGCVEHGSLNGPAAPQLGGRRRRREDRERTPDEERDNSGHDDSLVRSGRGNPTPASRPSQKPSPALAVVSVGETCGHRPVARMPGFSARFARRPGADQSTTMGVVSPGEPAPTRLAAIVELRWRGVPSPR
jgi:hypothetical protein